MRWKVEPPKEWRRWFAWYPVILDGQWVWLETLERKQIRVMGSWDDVEWRYREAP